MHYRRLGERYYSPGVAIHLQAFRDQARAELSDLGATISRSCKFDQAAGKADGVKTGSHAICSRPGVLQQLGNSGRFVEAEYWKAF